MRAVFSGRSSRRWSRSILTAAIPLVRAKTKPEAERVGKYMLRPVLALERLTFLEPEGKVGYRWGRDGAGQETMDYLEFIARVTAHIPAKGQVMVRYYGLYANAHRGKVRKASLASSPLRIVEEELRRLPAKGWAALIRKPHRGLRSAEMIRKVYEVDPMTCPNSEASLGLRSAALMIRGRLMRTAKRCPHDPWPSHEDCEALPEMRGPDEGRRLSHGVCPHGGHED
jgi:hypothetical protein